MTKAMHLLLALGLVVASIGCAGDDASAPDAGSAAASNNTTNAAETPAVTGDFTLVNLKVPNMT